MITAIFLTFKKLVMSTCARDILMAGLSRIYLDVHNVGLCLKLLVYTCIIRSVCMLGLPLLHKTVTVK